MATPNPSDTALRATSFVKAAALCMCTSSASGTERISAGVASTPGSLLVVVVVVVVIGPATTMTLFWADLPIVFLRGGAVGAREGQPVEMSKGTQPGKRKYDAVWAASTLPTSGSSMSVALEGRCVELAETASV